MLGEDPEFICEYSRQALHGTREDGDLEMLVAATASPITNTSGRENNQRDGNREDSQNAPTKSEYVHAETPLQNRGK
ncbi:hypothetical protein Misp02_34550 [Microtetraspora sp. NBRC 16547]|nr:hypothetical protein Misp02_34550 [Microtetraspora sp. NBRC 16547]